MWASCSLPERHPKVDNQQPYRTVIRHSIIALSPRATYTLRFDQIGDVFQPGMVGNDIHPRALGDLCAFAKDVNCTVAKDDKAKAFVFIKRN
jgi:hypothetical protein